MTKPSSHQKLKTLDLHGCLADEVQDKVDHFIHQGQKSGQHQLRIMTGKGKGIVKKVVIDYLNLGRFPWHYEKMPNGQLNEGVLIVSI